MKRVYRIMTSLFAGILLFSCIKDDYCISYLLINNSDIPVDFYVPRKAKRGEHPVGKHGEMHDLDETDSTLFLVWDIFRCLSYPPMTSGPFPCGYTSINEMSNYDLVRVWVVDGSYHFSDMNHWKYKLWEDFIKEDDDYLVRYDFTLSDLEMLMNENREIVICYPPDSTMKDIHMWPRYDTFQSRSHL